MCLVYCKANPCLWCGTSLTSTLSLLVAQNTGAKFKLFAIMTIYDKTLGCVADLRYTLLSSTSA